MDVAVRAPGRLGDLPGVALAALTVHAAGFGAFDNVWIQNRRDIPAGIASAHRSWAAAEESRQHLALSAHDRTGEVGECVEFEPERLVVGEAPMEPAQFMQRHYIEKPKNGIDLEEMAGAIEMLPPPREPRRVFDFPRWRLVAMEGLGPEREAKMT